MSHTLLLTVIDLRFGTLCKKFWLPDMIFILQCSIIPQNDDIHHFLLLAYSEFQRIELFLRFHASKKWHLLVVLPRHDTSLNYFIRHHFYDPDQIFKCLHIIIFMLRWPAEWVDTYCCKEPCKVCSYCASPLWPSWSYS